MVLSLIFVSPPCFWDFHFWRHLREPEIAEFVDLSTLIHDHHPSLSRFDSRIFSSGTFSFSSFNLCLFTLRIPPFPIGLFGLPSHRPKSKLSFGKLLQIEFGILTSINPFTHMSLSPISCSLCLRYRVQFPSILHYSFSWRLLG